MQTPDSYIESFPEPTQNILTKIRQTISNEAPQATETISYGIIGYKLKGHVLVYFGGFENHISLYPRTKGVERALTEELKPYSSGKGTIKFDISKPIPYELVRKIVSIRKQETEERYGKSK